MDWKEILFLILCDLVITVLFYLLVPVIISLRHKPLTKKQIKRIVIINGIVVWFIFQIITLELTGEASKSGAVFLWSAVASGILKKCCLSKDKPISKENHSVSSAVPAQTTTPPQHQNIICPKCGGWVSPSTKRCIRCDKRYSKGGAGKTVALVVVSILLIFSIGLNVTQYFEHEYCDEIIRNRNNEISRLEADIWEFRSATSFYEKHAVCVSCDNPDTYHKYGCRWFDDSEFWIFNTEYAQHNGYEPCPYCCG